MIYSKLRTIIAFAYVAVFKSRSENDTGNVCAKIYYMAPNHKSHETYNCNQHCVSSPNYLIEKTKLKFTLGHRKLSNVSQLTYFTR